MLRNTQSQNAVEYSNNLSGLAKKRIGMYQSSFEPAMAEAKTYGNLSEYTKKNSEIKADEINKAASLTVPAPTSPAVTRAPDAAPPVTIQPPQLIQPVQPTQPVSVSGMSIYDLPGSKIKPGTFADRWTQGGYGNLRQGSLGQPITLRDAFSILAKGGYGSF